MIERLSQAESPGKSCMHFYPAMFSGQVSVVEKYNFKMRSYQFIYP